MELFLGKINYAYLTGFRILTFHCASCNAQMKDTDVVMFFEVLNRNIEIWFCIINLTIIITTVPIVGN